MQELLVFAFLVCPFVALCCVALFFSVFFPSNFAKLNNNSLTIALKLLELNFRTQSKLEFNSTKFIAQAEICFSLVSNMKPCPHGLIGRAVLLY